MKGLQFSLEGVRKGYLVCQKCYIKGYGFGSRGGASMHQTLMSVPPGLPRSAG